MKIRLMEKKISLLAFLITFFFYGCKKDIRNFHLMGNLRSESSLEAISSASVLLYEYNSCGWGCENKDLIEETKTDDDGRFELKVHPKTSRIEYGLTVSHPKYFTTYKIIKKDELDFWKKNRIFLTSKPVATLILNIKNATPQYLNDELLVHLEGYSNNNPIPSFEFGYKFFTGMSVDTTLRIMVNGNRTTAINISVVKLGISKDSIVTIYCPQFETTSYNLNY